MRSPSMAAMISAFGEPDSAAARELVDIPVVGIAEAAFLVARTLGSRYAVLERLPPGTDTVALGERGSRPGCGLL